ncbi:Smr/MutS family protein [Ascidiimonas aurantiaca]|uniref:Smr/MutS family protein n=1 Tax=Ascidiimonas aurantiaca TaxID=1685432 RepID=UPI0030EECF5E
MVFKKGDRVELLDEMLKGRISLVKGMLATVLLDEGFEMEVPVTQLIKVPPKGVAFKVTNYEVAEAKKEKEVPPAKKKIAPRAKERNAPAMEVDLHIHQLTDSSKGMSNYDMLTLQIETAKRRLEFAMQNRIPKIVFIHGVGEGVLKNELEYLFGHYENISFYDADYRKYGLGATEVYIFQNKNA